QRVEVAPEKVRAPDGTGEEHVTSEHPARADERDAPRRVVRRMPHQETMTTNHQFVAVAELDIRRGQCRRGQAELRSLFPYTVIERTVRRVQEHGRPGELLGRRNAEYVIEMRVREPDAIHL